MPEFPQIDRESTTQGLFDDAFIEANSVANRFDRLRVRGRGDPSTSFINVPRSNLGVVPFTDRDDKTGRETISDHIKLMKGLPSPSLLAVTTRYPDFAAATATRLSAAAFRGDESYPDYLIKKDPSTGLIVCKLGRAGLTGEARADEPVGISAFYPDTQFGQLDPEDTGRLGIVLGAISNRVAELHAVGDIIENMAALRRVEYTGAEPRVELIPAL